jgi:glycosyl transferase family 25
MHKSKIKFYSIFLLVAFSFYCSYQLLTTKSIQIDKIYVINLDRSWERYKQMQFSLDKMNLPVKYTRFSAFDGDDIELLNKETGERIKGSEFANNTTLLKGKFEIICTPQWPGGLEPINLNLTNFHPRVKGELGCACSHRKIWQEIINHGYKNVLVLEDDIAFAQNFDKYLARALNFTPTDYDFIYIGILDSIDSYKDFLKNKFLRKIKRIFDRDFNNPFFKQVRRSVGSTESYIVNQEGAKKLLKDTTKYHHIDKVISKLIEKKQITAYVIKPVLTQQTGTSIIGTFLNNDYETLKQE